MTALDDSLQYEKEGRYAKAFELLQECLGDEKYDQGEISFHCGWCLENHREGDEKKAISFYHRAADIGHAIPLRVHSFFRAGWLLLHQKDYRGAALDFKKAVDCAEEAKDESELYCQSAYWLAVCLEIHGQYLEALKWYRRVENIAPLLDPESRFRQILCLNQIGFYEDALRICLTFENPPPPGFGEKRYDELRAVAGRERKLLEKALSIN